MSDPIPEAAIEAAWLASSHMDISVDELTHIIMSTTPHVITAALAGHINRGPMEGFVGERCERGRWSDSDGEYIAHVSEAGFTA